MRLLACLLLLAALAAGQTTTLTGTVQTSPSPGVYGTANVTVTFHENQNKSVSAIVTVNGQSCALNLPKLSTSLTGTSYYAGSHECNGLEVKLGILTGHPQGPAASLDFSQGGTVGGGVLL